MKRKGQSFLEYSLLIGCVVITLFAMQAYFKRGIQGVIKSTSDDLGYPVLDYTGIDAQTEGARGKGEFVQNSPSTITSDQEITTNEFASGQRGFVINQDVRRTTGGFTVNMPLENYDDESKIGNPIPSKGTAEKPKE